MSSGPEAQERPRRATPGVTTPGASILATAGAYGLLFAFGALQGLIGSLQFSRSAGSVPLAALCFAVAIGLTCWLCGRGMGTPGGAVAPAAGWVLVSFVLAMPNSNGTVVITNSTAGGIYLYGGALCAAVAVGAAFSRRRRPQA